MKNVAYIFLFIIIFNNCGSNKYQYNTEKLKKITIERNKIAIYENEKKFVLIADNNDIIEAFKEPYNYIKSCKTISLNKKQKFKVFNNDIFDQGSLERKYFVNDTLLLDYNQYYTIPTFKKYCYDKQDVPILKKKLE